MTPTQADREAAAEIWQSVKRAFLKDAGPEYDDIGNTLALPYAIRHRLAAEAAAFEKAAMAVQEEVRNIDNIIIEACRNYIINRDAGRSASMNPSLEYTATLVVDAAQKAIRKLAGEKA